jgi:hypothetical protein
MPHGLCRLVLCLPRFTLLRVMRRSFDFAHVGSRMAIHTINFMPGKLEKLLWLDKVVVPGLQNAQQAPEPASQSAILLLLLPLLLLPITAVDGEASGRSRTRGRSW